MRRRAVHPEIDVRAAVDDFGVSVSIDRRLGFVT
jgi:hypothetical protein